MSNNLNDDFKDFLNALNEAEVSYILVGGYAVIFHGYNRTTGDLDIWVHASKENFQKLLKAFSIFGLSPFDMTLERFLNTKENEVFTFGRPPVCIEILTKISGLEFDSTYSHTIKTDFFGVWANIIDLRNLKINKSSTDRFKDKSDLEHL
jgi:hypothetical protein